MPRRISRPSLTRQGLQGTVLGLAMASGGEAKIDELGGVNFSYQTHVTGTNLLPDRIHWLWLRKNGTSFTHGWAENGAWLPYDPNNPTPLVEIGTGDFSSRWQVQPQGAGLIRLKALDGRCGGHHPLCQCQGSQ